MVFVLVHGGGFGGSCWDRMVPFLAEPAIAVDLPGRGSRPGDVATITLDEYVDATVEDIERGDLTDVVLVGHSAAGLSLPGVVARIPQRLRRVVFVSCLVPDDGKCAQDMFDATITAAADQANADDSQGTLHADVARAWFANDMDDADADHTLSLLVPEPMGTTMAPVSLAALRATVVPKTWVRLLRDVVLPVERQERFRANAGADDVVELDAGHMAMISRPAELAAILNELAAR
jgi:pimeloyl-ACP methyl ester carboxylesterase